MTTKLYGWDGPPQNSEGPPLACISVITVARNDLDGLKKTLRSVALQTFGEIEHIVIDGGSTDGSAEWAANHLAHPRSVLLSEPDDGIYDAMNKGLGLATGDLVYFLNAGDCLSSSDVLGAVVKNFGERNWEWAVGASQMVDGNDVAVRAKMPVSYHWWKRTFWHYNLSQQAVIFRTDVLRKFGGFDPGYSIAGDYHIVAKIGRQYRPELLPITIAYTLAGGVSDRRLAAAHYEAHKARVDVLSLGLPLRRLDACWTGVLIGKVYARRLGKKLMQKAQAVQVALRSTT